MAVETASYIDDLNASWPDDNDDIPEGDNHIRLIKAVLKYQFPNLGATVQVTPTAEELNYVDGVTSAIQTQLNALDARITVNEADLADHETRITTLEGNIIEAATKALFVQAAAPTSWTLDAANDDAVIRNRSTAGGGTGGSWTISGVTVDGHALTEAENGPHAHGAGSLVAASHAHAQDGNTYKKGGTSDNNPSGTPKASSLGGTTGLSGALGISGTSGSSGSGDPHTHGLTADGAWRPKYVDVITCTKDAF